MSTEVVTIVKIQRPMQPPDGPWLVYDQRRKMMQTMPQSALPPKVIRAMGDDLKGYFNATCGGGALVIGHRVAEQDW